MRLPTRVAALVAGAVAAVVPLAGCDHPASVSVQGPESIEVSGDVGSIPTVTFEPPIVVEEPSVTTVIDGGDATIPDGAPLLVDWIAFDGSTGNAVGETYSTAPQVLALTADSVGEELYDLVDDAGFGDRLLVLEPTAGVAGVPGSLVTVIDVRAARAQGAAVPPPRDCPWSPSPPTAPRPSPCPGPRRRPTSSSRSLIKGTGEQVEADSELIVQYTAVRWSDGSVHSTTWGAGLLPESLELTGAIDGLQEGLLDQTVGSQVLLVVPPDKAYGDDTLVLVVDVLAVVHEPTATPTATPSATPTPTG